MFVSEIAFYMHVVATCLACRTSITYSCTFSHTHWNLQLSHRVALEGKSAKIRRQSPIRSRCSEFRESDSHNLKHGDVSPLVATTFPTPTGHFYRPASIFAPLYACKNKAMYRKYLQASLLSFLLLCNATLPFRPLCYFSC